MADALTQVVDRTADFPPHPGSPKMPRWEGGELPETPVFHWKSLSTFLGPGVVMAAAAIGGGEWLTGPLVTARYGGALLWLATLSIIGQVIYNIEISRYTLYTGEPIFTGKFRTLPGPMFWLLVYLVLDCGSLLPYLASHAAIPAAALYLGRLPDSVTDSRFLTILSCVIFVSVLLPLTVGGKVYNSLKMLMSLKLVVVMGFLVFLAVFYSKPDTWTEIGTGFVQFGSFPVISDEDTNGNGKRDEGEMPLKPKVENIMATWSSGRLFPRLDLSMIGILVSMIAISGNGGLSNTPISNFTREQGWGMGKHVGAIPSIVGGHAIELSHVGMVFRVSRESLERWSRWVHHVQREQIYLWMPACFLGLALPSMLSVQFLPRGLELKDRYQAAAMTADGVGEVVGGSLVTTRDDEGEIVSQKRPLLNQLFWSSTLFCGFLVLATSMITTADGVLRRWVDVCWTALPSLQKWDTKHIGKLYFGVLCVYALLGLVMLCFVKGDVLLIFSGMIYNYALGFSSWHVVLVNSVLLPQELRPSWRRRIALACFGTFFLTAAAVSTWVEVPKLMAEINKPKQSVTHVPAVNADRAGK